MVNYRLNSRRTIDNFLKGVNVLNCTKTCKRDEIGLLKVETGPGWA
jgi:hypothetical protein